MVTQDLVAVQSQIFGTCKVDKLLSSLTGMFSLEGLSELGARTGGVVFFEWAAF